MLGAQAPAEQQLLCTFQFGLCAFAMTSSRVFMDFSMDNSPLGRFPSFHPSDFLPPNQFLRVIFELFNDPVPKTSEKFVAPL